MAPTNRGLEAMNPELGKITDKNILRPDAITVVRGNGGLSSIRMEDVYINSVVPSTDGSSTSLTLRYKDQSGGESLVLPIPDGKRVGACKTTDDSGKDNIFLVYDLGNSDRVCYPIIHHGQRLTRQELNNIVAILGVEGYPNVDPGKGPSYPREQQDYVMNYLSQNVFPNAQDVTEIKTEAPESLKITTGNVNVVKHDADIILPESLDDFYEQAALQLQAERDNPITAQAISELRAAQDNLSTTRVGRKIDLLRFFKKTKTSDHPVASTGGKLQVSATGDVNLAPSTQLKTMMYGDLDAFRQAMEAGRGYQARNDEYRPAAEVAAKPRSEHDSNRVGTLGYSENGTAPDRPVDEDYIRTVEDWINNHPEKKTQIIDRIKKRGVLFALADGMGGHGGGDRASQLAVDTLFDRFYLGNDDGTSSNDDFTVNAIEEANRAVYHESISGTWGMGTTISVLRVNYDHRAGNGWTAVPYNVGNSPIVTLGGQCQQHTIDETHVADLYRKGKIKSWTQALAAKGKGILTNSIGHKLRVNVNIGSNITIDDGTAACITDDGVYYSLEQTVTLEEMKQIYDQCGGDASRAEREIVNRAKQNGSTDDRSAIIVNKARISGILKKLGL